MVHPGVRLACWETGVQMELGRVLIYPTRWGSDSSANATLIFL